SSSTSDRATCWKGSPSACSWASSRARTPRSTSPAPCSCGSRTARRRTVTEAADSPPPSRRLRLPQPSSEARAEERPVMRIALWLLVLVTVCAGLLLWNERITVDARAERDQLRGGRGSTGDGFDHAIVGEKSGAPLLEVAPLPTPPPGAVPGTDPNRRNESGPD